MPLEAENAHTWTRSSCHQQISLTLVRSLAHDGAGSSSFASFLLRTNSVLRSGRCGGYGVMENPSKRVRVSLRKPEEWTASGQSIQTLVIPLSCPLEHFSLPNSRSPEGRELLSWTFLLLGSLVRLHRRLCHRTDSSKSAKCPVVQIPICSSPGLCQRRDPDWQLRAVRHYYY